MRDFETRVNIGVKGFESFGDVARVLGRVQRNFPKWVDKSIKDEAKERKKDAAARILLEPAYGGEHTGLREAISRGLEVAQVEDDEGDAGYRVITSVPKDDEAIIPRGFDTTWNGWRHPIFAKKDTPEYDDPRRWTRQHGAFSWFMTAMEPAEPNLTKAIGADMDRAVEEIHDSAFER